MSPWTCPNNKCEYDKQLQPRQRCPLCNEEAQEFKFDRFGTLLNTKKRLKNQMKKSRKRKGNLERAKYCPKCGSPEVDFLVYFNPSIWRCLNCGYEGVFVVEGSEFADKIREHYRKTDEHKI